MSSVVLTIGPGLTLREAARLMSERGIGCAVVINEDMPGPGVLSERDVISSLGRGQNPDVELVGNHQSDSMISAAPDWSLERAAVEMAKRHIRHLVVVEGAELVGVLSIRDIVRVWTQDGATSSMTSPDTETANA